MTSRRDLYATARRAFERGEFAQWEAAEAMAGLAEEYGETHRQIAEEVGCSHITVGRYLAVWHGTQGSKLRPSFAEAMAKVRGPRKEIPRTTAGRADLAAKLLADKAVADAPEVRKVEKRHAERRARAEAQDFNREHGIHTRTKKNHTVRRQSPNSNEMFWWNYLGELKRMAKLVGDANGEYDRTGMPNKHAGDIIKAQRALLRALERVNEKARTTGVGKAM